LSLPDDQSNPKRKYWFALEPVLALAPNKLQLQSSSGQAFWDTQSPSLIAEPKLKAGVQFSGEVF
jgi:hypothetical protein